MSYGIEFYSDSGRLLIGSTYPGMRLYSSGRVKVGHMYRGGGSVPLPSGTLDYIVFLNPPSEKPITFKDGRVIMPLTEDYNTYVGYKVFVKTDTVSPSPHNFGLQVFNSKGKLTFDFDNTIFNVISASTLRGSSRMYIGSDWLAITSVNMAGLAIGSGGYTGWAMSSFIRKSGNYIKSGIAPFTTGPRPSYNVIDDNNPISVIRVKII